jgi:protein-tyrosine phosphatase
MGSILFVCTGNIFRSMTAEHALRHALGESSAISVGSAGTEATPQTIPLVVRRRLLERGIDPSHHRQRRLDHAIIRSTSLVIAMGRDHQIFVREQFNRHAPLFLEICDGQAEPVLDIHEALPNWQDNPAAAARYAVEVVDRICEAIPRLINNLELR